MRLALACALLASACGRVGFAPAVGGDPGVDGGPQPDAFACTSFGPWSTPTRIDGLVSIGNDWEAALHPGGELLAFASDRAGSSALYLGRRSGETWNLERAVDELDTPDDDLAPTWSADGTLLYFSRGVFPMARLHQTTFDGTAFGTPSLVAGLEAKDIASAALTADGQHMVYSGYFGRLGTASWTGSAWQFERTVDEIVEAIFPTMTADGTTVFYENFVNGPLQIWEATRATVDDLFGPGAVVPSLDLPGSDEGDPKLSADGRTMLLSSTAPSSTADVFISTRACQ